MNSNKLIEELNFEEALLELESIVKKIDTGEQDLNQSIENFERGIKLKKHCEKMLNEAKMKVEKIIMSDNNQTSKNNDPSELFAEEINIQ